MPSASIIKSGELPEQFQRFTTLENWNRFAAVNDEFVPIHMDDEAGREAGFDTAIGMGNLQWSYFHNYLRDIIAAYGSGQGRIERIGCKFESANLKNTTVVVSGTVTATSDRDGGQVVEIDLQSKDDRGNRLAAGQATIFLAGTSA